MNCSSDFKSRVWFCLCSVSLAYSSSFFFRLPQKPLQQRSIKAAASSISAFSSTNFPLAIILLAPFCMKVTCLSSQILSHLARATHPLHMHCILSVATSSLFQYAQHLAKNIRTAFWHFIAAFWSCSCRGHSFLLLMYLRHLACHWMIIRNRFLYQSASHFLVIMPRTSAWMTLIFDPFLKFSCICFIIKYLCQKDWITLAASVSLLSTSNMRSIRFDFMVGGCFRGFLSLKTLLILKFAAW
mmetsp:Transcript_6777/g.12216  ORF Transcript_6777/g.12216 Transcript_6777/m.12216 type:complete len:242 (-) Transcript_6777:159-884(-)